MNIKGVLRRAWIAVSALWGLFWIIFAVVQVNLRTEGNLLVIGLVLAPWLLGLIVIWVARGADVD